MAYWPVNWSQPPYRYGVNLKLKFECVPIEKQNHGVDLSKKIPIDGNLAELGQKWSRPKSGLTENALCIWLTPKICEN